MAQIISIATQNPVVLRPIDKFSDAIEIMAKNGFRRLPIIWENRLEGILTAKDVLAVINQKGLELLEEEVHNFMTREPIFVYRDDDLSQAVQVMFQHDLGSLPIISQRDNTLAGIVTERDLVKAFTKNAFADADLSEFITPDPLTKSFATTTVKQSIKAMTDMNIRRIILIDKKKAVKGIVTSTDIMRYLSDQIILNAESSNDVLKEKVSKFANTDVFTVNFNDSVAEVAQILVEKGMGGVPVTHEGALVGVFTERDILRLVGTYNLI